MSNKTFFFPDSCSFFISYPHATHTPNAKNSTSTHQQKESTHHRLPPADTTPTHRRPAASHKNTYWSVDCIFTNFVGTSCAYHLPTGCLHTTDCCLPAAHRPPTSRPLTADQLPTSCRPAADQLPTSCRHTTDHSPTTQQPAADTPPTHRRHTAYQAPTSCQPATSQQDLLVSGLDFYRFCRHQQNQEKIDHHNSLFFSQSGMKAE